jgi:XTP/dITP diphosphohydrolase
MQILIATTNPGKLREFRQMLGNEFSYLDLSALPNIHEIEETGHTFAENAALKASGYALQTKQWTLADDSGLMVDALHGSPGIYSARWSQKHNRSPGDAQNNQLLLEQLKDIPDAQRSARFVCALALSDPTGQIALTAEDFVAGQILQQGRGSHGFGYDPLFYIPELHRTAAELSPDEKSRISHRGKALRKLKKYSTRLNHEWTRMDTNKKKRFEIFCSVFSSSCPFASIRG